jgi:hypothetical protein
LTTDLLNPNNRHESNVMSHIAKLTKFMVLDALNVLDVLDVL